MKAITYHYVRRNSLDKLLTTVKDGDLSWASYLQEMIVLRLSMAKHFCLWLSRGSKTRNGKNGDHLE